MNYFKSARFLVSLSLVLIILSVTMVSAGCSGEQISGPAASEIYSTMVPALDLDMYIYVNQETPTRVPRSLTGAKIDISVQSLAIWGIVDDDTHYAVSGALNFPTAVEAVAVFGRISEVENVYLKLSDRTIYFVQGSGIPAESLKNAVDHNLFKQYDDKMALDEISRLPSGVTTKPAVIGIVKPSQAAVNLIARYVDQSTANTLNSIFSNVKTRIITLGAFGSQPFDLADMEQRLSSNTIWDLDIGIVVSIDSVYPGFIFSPIAGRMIGSKGIPEVKVGELTAYKYSIKLGNDRNIPLYLNVSGNHVFAVASGKDTYAQTLLTGIAR